MKTKIKQIAKDFFTALAVIICFIGAVVGIMVTSIIVSSAVDGHWWGVYVSFFMVVISIVALHIIPPVFIKKCPCCENKE